MTILAATDRSQNSEAALRLAARLAARLGEPLVIMSVLELWERRGDVILPTFEDVDIEPSEHALELVNEFVSSVITTGEYEVRTIIGHPPAERILDAANELNARMIVVGTSGHSRLAEAFFGSTVSALVRSADQPVLAVPPDFSAQIDSILAPVDFSDCSVASLLFAGEMAARLDAELSVYHSIPMPSGGISTPVGYVPPPTAVEVKEATQQVHDMVARVKLSERVTRTIVEVGPPHPGILEAATQHKVDLIVMGTHGRTGIAKLFLGSTAERMLRDRTCPILVTRATAD